MCDYKEYLLRTESQLSQFRNKYATFINNEQSKYVSWINRLPLLTWVNYLQGIPETNIPIMIGMLCHIYCAGLVNISFHKSMLMIRREPIDEDEWLAWCQSEATTKHKNKKQF